MKGKEDRKTIVGIDIGSDAVKVVRGMKLRGGISISDFAQKKFLEKGPQEAVMTRVQEALSSLVDAQKIKKESVHASISGRDLCIRVITLPAIPMHELEQLIKAKIDKYISMDIDDVYFQFAVVGEKHTSGTKKLDVMFAAIKKSIFDDYLHLFATLNIRPRLVTSPCFSGWNLVRQLGLHQSVTSVMLININDQETDLTIYREKQFVLTRNIFIGTVTKGAVSGLQPPLLPIQPVDTLLKEIELI